MKDDNVFRAARGLHGGIGGRGDVCGALLGACLMLGLMCGDSPEVTGNSGKKDVTAELASDLYKWFKQEFGSVKCRIVRGKYEKEVAAEPDARGLTEMERRDRVNTRCDKLAGKTSARTAEMLWDILEEANKQ